MKPFLPPARAPAYREATSSFPYSGPPAKPAYSPPNLPLDLTLAQGRF